VAITMPAEPKLSGPQGASVEVLDRLRRWRSETAIAGGVPAYVVFHDATLTAIAAARPSSLSELLRISGVGESKLRKYGEDLLEVLKAAPA
jgi:superfamily II DNA helicase RecQ